MNRSCKHLIFLIVAIGLLPLMPGQLWAQVPAVQRLVHAAPIALPATPIFDENGQSTPLNATTNDPAPYWRLVNIWATWCTPCVQELPSLAKLRASWPNDRLQVMAVAWENGAGKNKPAQVVQDFYRANKIDGLPVLYEPTGKLLAGIKARGLPVTLLINPAGMEVARYVGQAEWDSDGIKLWLSGLITNP
jgi:thiol-disulfide isomerase/thioredoxin